MNATQVAKLSRSWRDQPWERWLLLFASLSGFASGGAARLAADDEPAEPPAAQAPATDAKPAETPAAAPAAEPSAGETPATASPTAEAKADTTPAADAGAAASDTAQPNTAASKPSGLGERSDKQVGVGEQLDFRQAKVAAEMRELEDRMFRLADSLQAQEPENASRLRLGLKYSRDELLHHQMVELQQMLARLKLGEASIEQKQLLIKLQRLQDMLLSPDLDFQVKLERLRQIREILRRLDRAIAEEQREQGLSAAAKGQQQQQAALAQHWADLAALIARQREHLAHGQRLAGQHGAADPASQDDAPPDAPALAQRQHETRSRAQALIEARGPLDAGDTDHLAAAILAMQAASTALEAADAPAAVAPLEQALAALVAENDRLAAVEAQLARELARERFLKMQRDQTGNRESTDTIAELVRTLGEQGAGAQNELSRAVENMSNAEGRLGQTDAAGADEEQTSAAAALISARNMLDEEAQKLLNALRNEVKKRVLEDLSLMLERQIAIRTSISVLGPRVAEGSRQASTAVVALAAREGQLVQTAADLVALVEETEFGIALPAALGTIRDAMADVQTSLAAAVADEPVVAAERQIEEDLRSLMDAMKQMPGSGPPGRGGAGSPNDRQRELNRLVAELKTVRILETRMHRDTQQTDSARVEGPLPAQTRQTIEHLQGRQEDLREIVDRLNAERGAELQQ